MSDRPAVAPGVVASLVEQAPKRLVRKLDKKPDQATAWSWRERAQRWTVETDRGEVVVLDSVGGLISDIEQLSCSCLLSPRCLHVLSVVSTLSIADDFDEQPLEEISPRTDADEDSSTAEGRERPDARQIAAAQVTWKVAAQVLAAGGSATGAVLQAELLRAIHGCRAAKLPRLSAAGLRLIRSIRDLREDRVEFRLETLSANLLEVLRCSWAIGDEGLVISPDRMAAWVGRARRAYTPAGNLKLHGLFSEPIVAASGYAGVVTYLAHESGELYTLSDVQPGEPERALASYSAPAAVGDVTEPHRQLSRGGVLLQDATASNDGRLGAGKQVRAVRTEGASWGDEAFRHLWSKPLGEQLDRIWGAVEAPLDERRAGWDLVFLQGIVVGAQGASLTIVVPPEGMGAPLALRVLAPNGHSALRYRENLRQLARCPGLPIRFVGRVRSRQPRTVYLLAIGVEDPPSSTDSEERVGPALRLPRELHGRVNLGFDRLRGSWLVGAREDGSIAELALREGEAPLLDPLAGLRRRVHRLSLGGRGTLPPEAGATLSAEIASLERRMLPTAAETLRRLVASASSMERTLAGQRRIGTSEDLARSWVRAAIYEDSATRELHRTAWD